MPSPQSLSGTAASSPASSPGSVTPNTKMPLAIIPPRKERIVSAIEKSYTIIRTFRSISIEYESDCMENNEKIMSRPTVLQKIDGNKPCQSEDSIDGNESDMDNINQKDNEIKEPKLESFNRVFLNKTFETSSYVSMTRKDQVLAAVQLADDMPSTSTNTTPQIHGMKRSSFFEDTNILTKKLCEEQLEQNLAENEDLFTDPCFDVLLDDAGQYICSTRDGNQTVSLT